MEGDQDTTSDYRTLPDSNKKRRGETIKVRQELRNTHEPEYKIRKETPGIVQQQNITHCPENVY